MASANTNIINIGIFAHVDAGKTTLTEQLLKTCGKIRQVGSVDSGTAQTDFLTVERERGISVVAAATDIEWKNYHINIIDTPGHIDFAGETERAMIALDGAVLVVSAVEGVQSHTENLWKAFDALNIPCVVFINKIDRAGSDTESVIEALRELDGFVPHVITEAVSQEDRNCSVQLTEYNNEELIEFLADYNDDIADAYLEGKSLSGEKLINVLKEAVAEVDTGDGVIVFCDMLFGSPCNCIARVIAEDLESDKIQVVTGVNLAMILQILSVREASDPTIEELTKSGLDGIADLKAVLKANMQ